MNRRWYSRLRAFVVSHPAEVFAAKRILGPVHYWTSGGPSWLWRAVWSAGDAEIAADAGRPRTEPYFQRQGRRCFRDSLCADLPPDCAPCRSEVSETERLAIARCSDDCFAPICAPCAVCVPHAALDPLRSGTHAHWVLVQASSLRLVSSRSPDGETQQRLPVVGTNLASLRSQRAAICLGCRHD